MAFLRSERVPFEPLLEGKESSKATQVRYEDYVKAIQCLEKKVENFLLTVNESAISDLCDFVINTYDKGEINDCQDDYQEDYEASDYSIDPIEDIVSDISKIPIVLMLGITTCIRGIDPLRENYSYSVVRLLKPEAFYLRTQKARCDDLVSQSKLHQPAEARRLLCDDYYVKSLLPTFSQNIATYHQRFAIALEFIIFLQEFLDYDAKKLKSKYELYSIALKKPGLGENDYIQTLLDDLIKIDPKKIGELLQVFISLLKTVLNHVENIEQEYEDFCHFLVRTKEIENDLTRPSASTRSSITKMKNKESAILQKIEKIGDDYKKLVIDVTNYLAIFF
ncbi:5065_t:CDS:2, partial [Racocetra fulgida]